MARGRLRRIAIALALATGIAAAAGARRIEPLFTADDVLAFRLEAPLHDLFTHTRHGQDASATGAVVVDGHRIGDVEVATRGHTSADECTFYKLKLRFRDVPDATPFAGLKDIKIGTHCGNAPDNQLTRRFGRLANPKSPHREALVYRILHAVGVTTLEARPAEITYVSSPRAAPLVRPAFLLEDARDARQRLGASGEIEASAFESAAAAFSRADLANVLFGEAMIGNFDWCLKMTRDDTYRCDASKRLWNVLALRRDGNRALPLIYDFDLSGIVTGRHIWFAKVFSEGFDPSMTMAAIEVVAQIQRARSVLSRADLDAARRRFLDRKAAAFHAIETGAVDPDGAANARRYLTAFFDAIATDDAFYRPVVTADRARIFLDAARTTPARGRESTVRAGTVVGPPTARDGRMVRVRLLDVLWRWTGRSACEAARAGEVWIDGRAIGRDYPAH